MRIPAVALGPVGDRDSLYTETTQENHLSTFHVTSLENAFCSPPRPERLRDSLVQFFCLKFPLAHHKIYRSQRKVGAEQPVVPAFSVRKQRTPFFLGFFDDDSKRVLIDQRLGGGHQRCPVVRPYWHSRRCASVWVCCAALRRVSRYPYPISLPASDQSNSSCLLFFHDCPCFCLPTQAVD